MGEGDHLVAVAAEHIGLHVADGDIELLRQERAEAGRIENASHPHDSILGEPRGVVGVLHHCVERIRDDDQGGLRRLPHDLSNDGADDLHVGEQQIVAAHTGLTGYPRGDDDDVGAG